MSWCLKSFRNPSQHFTKSNPWLPDRLNIVSSLGLNFFLLRMWLFSGEIYLTILPREPVFHSHFSNIWSSYLRLGFHLRERKQLCFLLPCMKETLSVRDPILSSSLLTKRACVSLGNPRAQAIQKSNPGLVVALSRPFPPGCPPPAPRLAGEDACHSQTKLQGTS